jgi:hypothetical protein
MASMDIKNALGSVHWDHAIKTATALAPRLVPALATMWGPGSMAVHVQSSHAIWCTFEIRGSLIQG